MPEGFQLQTPHEPPELDERHWGSGDVVLYEGSDCWIQVDEESAVPADEWR